jgi:hypothetical protein
VITRRMLALAAAAIFAAGSSVVAHHAWPVDMSRLVTVSGTVTGYDWSDPHVMIALDVKAESGAIEKWNVGGPSMNRMAANGWDRSTLKPGDVITGTGYRFSDGQKIVRLERVRLSSGKEMLLYARR